MAEDINERLRKLNREHMFTIWQHAKENDLDELSDEERQLAKIMLEHDDEYHNHFEFADVMSDHEYDPETEGNPFLHITIHSIVENQLNMKDPIEAYQFYNAMRKRKVSHHETIHLIGNITARFLYYMLKYKKEFDKDFYKLLLKKYRNKKPDKIESALEKDFKEFFSG